jgi:hypothetical protein
MRRLFTAIAFLCVTVMTTAQTPAKTSIEGAWKVVEIVTTGTNAATNMGPQPGLYLFTKTHYSMVLVQGANVRKVNPLLPDATKGNDVDHPCLDCKERQRCDERPGHCERAHTRRQHVDPDSKRSARAIRPRGKDQAGPSRVVGIPIFSVAFVVPLETRS